MGQRHGKTRYQPSKRSLVVWFVAFWLSAVGLVFDILSRSKAERSVQPMWADLVGPVGLQLTATAVTAVVVHRLHAAN